MNNKERAVLYFLIISLFIGSVISIYRQKREKQNFKKIETELVTLVDIDTNIKKMDEIKMKQENLSFPIDINQATAQELEGLPGIGPVLAQKIIRERERIGKFSTLEDLLKISGIGKKKLEKIKNMIIIKN